MPTITCLITCKDGSQEGLTLTLDSIASLSEHAAQVVLCGDIAGVGLGWQDGRNDRAYVQVSGVSPASMLLRGLEVARGDLLVWLHPGDVLFNDGVKRIVESWQGNEGPPWYLGQGEWREGLSEEHAPVYPVGFRFSKRALLLGGNYVFRPSSFISVSALRRIAPLLDESLVHMVEYDLWLRLADLGEPQVVPALVASAVREESDSDSPEVWGQLTEVQQITRKHEPRGMTPGQLMAAVHFLKVQSAHSDLLPHSIEATLEGLEAMAVAAMVRMTGAGPGCPANSRPVVYFSTVALVAGRSGGIVGYLLGLANSMAEAGEAQVHVGLTNFNYRGLNKHFHEGVQRHRLFGVATQYILERELETITRVRADWVVYVYPGQHDLHAHPTRAFRTACCIPDLQHLTHPEFFTAPERLYRDKALQLAVGSADFLFTLSEHARVEICKVYGCERAEVDVIYPAPSSLYQKGPAPEDELGRLRKRYKLPKEYAIYPGNFWPHKNHDGLLSSLSILERRGVKVPVVLTGDMDHAAPALRDRLRQAEREGQVHVLGYVAEKQLHALMSGARCLVFPSLFEGFGIPLAEALSLGVPVACSDRCSLPEVGAGFVHYFDPDSPESMATAIEKVWTGAQNDEARYQRMIQGRGFDYRTSAAKLLKCLQGEGYASRPSQKTSIQVREPVRVSIVTPSFQQASYLKACIDSVLTQDYPHIEYAVFDGGSTDGSREILESYGRRFFWKSGPDGGQTSAINAGLRRAQGQILGYLNSDDLLLPGAVSAVVKEWERFPGADVVYGRANRIDEQGRLLGEYPTREFDLELFKADCFISQPAAFWHRRAMEKSGCLDESFQFAMDYEYWQRIACGGGLFLRLDQLLACSREHAVTKTFSQRGKIFHDIFRSQILHWGRIHEQWWLGYLRYLKQEKQGWAGRFVPGGSLQVGVARHLANVARPWTRWWKQPHKLMQIAREWKPCEVSGVDPDGWAGTDLKIPLQLAQKTTVFLEGYSPDEKLIRFSFGPAKRILVNAARDKKFVVENVLEAGTYWMRARCASSRQPGDPRALGFYMGATNAFLFLRNNRPALG